MSRWNDLVEELARMETAMRTSPDKAGYPGLGTDHSEMPSVFVRGWLAIAVFLVAILVCGVMCAMLNSGRPVPDYRHGSSHRSFPSVAVAAVPDADSGMIWVASRGGGVQRFDPRALFWETSITSASTAGRLPTDNLAGLNVTESAAALVFEDRDRRGLTFSSFDGAISGRCWAQPFIDTSHLGIDSSDVLTCATPGIRAGTVVVGSRNSGVGEYELDRRRWTAYIDKTSGLLADDRVNDVCSFPQGILVANRSGIDICRMLDGQWRRAGFIPCTAGQGVRKLHQVVTSKGIDVWYETDGDGAGTASITDDGRRQEPFSVISGRSVPGMSLNACFAADADESSGRLWVAFGQGRKAGVARYRFADHDWLGAARMLDRDDVFCLRATANGGLVGSRDGVWHIRENKESLASRNVGPSGEGATAVAACNTAVFARTESTAAEGEVGARIRMAGDSPCQKEGAWDWRDLVGPSRFPGLTMSDLLCVAQRPGTEEYYFGTNGKGVGLYRGDSHEVLQRFKAGEQDALPQDAIVDLAWARNGCLLAVSSDTLMSYDGNVWHRLVQTNGLDTQGQMADCADASGSAILAAADPAVGIYDMATRRWRPLEPLPGVTSVKFAAGRIWGITGERSLFALSEPNVGTSWVLRSKEVASFTGNAHAAVALAGAGSAPKHIFVAMESSAEMSAIAAPGALSRDIRQWRDACAFGANLYCVGADNSLARYDLSAHTWEQLARPVSGAVSRQIAVTAAGLWFLTEEGNLYLRSADTNTWTGPQTPWRVKTIQCDGSDVLALCEEHDAGGRRQPRLVMLHAGEAPSVIVGRALNSAGADVTAAAEYNGALFLGASEAIARYDGQAHDWCNYSTGAERVKAFVATNTLLYALLEADGSDAFHIVRYDPSGDRFTRLAEPGQSGLEMTVRRLAAGNNAIAVQRADGDVVLVRDDGAATTVWPSSRLAAEGTVVCAAESGEELYLGFDNGVLAGYQKDADGVMRWAETRFSTPADSEPVRKIIPLNGGADRVVVTDQSITLEHRSDGEGQWRTVRREMTDASRCDAWDDGAGSMVYAGTTNDADKAADCFSKITIGSTDRESVTVVGKGLASNGAVGATSSAVEFATPSDVWIFRLDSNGSVGCYSLATHSWEAEPIKGIGRIFKSLGTVWAYAPEDMTLYQMSLSGEKHAWAGYGRSGSIADIVEGENSVLLRHADGELEMLSLAPSGSRESRSIANGSTLEQRRNIGTPIAYAEVGGDLICSFSNGNTWLYKLDKHSWREVLAKKARQFTRDASGSIYAVCDDGSLYAWDGKSTDRFQSVSTPAGVDKMILLDGRVCISSKDVGLYLFGDDGRWTMLAGAGKRLAASRWPPISAVSEAAGRLVLGLVEEGTGEMVLYDPASMSWQRMQFQDCTPERFLACGDRLFAVCVSRGGAKSLWSLDGGRLVPVAQGLRCAAVCGSDIWCLSAEGTVLRVAGVDLKATPVTARRTVSALPGGIAAGGLMAAGPDLVALLTDGSIWHHAMGDLGWRCVLTAVPDMQPSFQRRVVEVGGVLLTSTPSGDLLAFDPAKDQYVHTEDHMASFATGAHASNWQIRTADGVMRVRAMPDGVWMTLSEGLLPSDDITDLSVDGNRLYCLTRSGEVRVLDRGTLKDIPANAPADDLHRKFERAPAWYLQSERFSCESTANGSWEAADPNTGLRICMKDGGNAQELLPHAADGQIGLAQQWPYDPQSLGKSLIAAIPGGVMCADVVNGALALKHTWILTEGAAAPAIARLGDNIFCRAGEDKRYVLDAAGEAWRAVAKDDPSCLTAFGFVDSVAARSLLESRWALSMTQSGPVLSVLTGSGKMISVSFEDGALGIDRVATMSLSDKRVLLYTRDGLLTYGQDNFGGAPESAEAGMATPNEMLADRCHVGTGASTAVPLAVSIDGKRAWLFSGKWQAEDVSTPSALPGDLPPQLLDGAYCKWGRNEEVELNWGGEYRMKTAFNAKTGRFTADEVVAIGAVDATCWAVTHSGIRKLNGKTGTVYQNSDSAFSWTGRWSFVRASVGGVDSLYACLQAGNADKPVVLRCDRGLWQQVIDAAEIEAIRAAREVLLDGAAWRVRRGVPDPRALMRFERHWDWLPSGIFQAVSINIQHSDRPGVFDFECVNDLTMEADSLWLATDCGLARVRLSDHRMTLLTAPSGCSKIKRLARKDATIYAETDEGVFSFNGRWERAAVDVFASPRLLVEGSKWRVGDNNGSLTISERLSSEEREFRNVMFCPVGDKQSRFDFDAVVSAAHIGGTVFLVTDRGLVRRTGRFGEDVAVEPCEGASGRKGDIFLGGRTGSQRLLYCEDGALFAYNSDLRAWRAEGRANGEDAPSPTSVLAWNDNWLVRKGASGIEVSVKMPEDLDYTQASFAPDAGLFAFDIFTDVRICDGDNGWAIFAATPAGIVRMRPDGSWRKRYMLSDDCGKGVCAIRLAGSGRDHLMASCVVPNNKASTECIFTYVPADDSWQEEPASPQSRHLFATLAATQVNDPDGWVVADREAYSASMGLPAPERRHRLGLEWRGQPVWFVGAGRDVRFAHDVFCSVACDGDDTWLGTAGGALRYRPREAQASLMDISCLRIHARDFLDAYDLWSAALPPRVGVLRAPSPSHIQCFLAGSYGDGSGESQARVDQNACYLLAGSAERFTAINDEDARADAPRSLIGLDDGFWRWVKTGPGSLRIEFDEGRADVPRDYQYLADGTFRFFDVSSRPEQSRDSVELLDGDVFIATAGGIMSFDVGSGKSAKLYAEAKDTVHGNSVSLETVNRLWFSRKYATLFAQTGTGMVVEYSSGADAQGCWRVYGGSDAPLADRDVVVENDLLRWRQSATGAVVTLTHSDMASVDAARLFSEGRFSFDRVNAVALWRGKAWLATDGGVVRVDGATRKIEYVHTRAFTVDKDVRASTVKEIVASTPDGPLRARTGDRRGFVLDAGDWKAACAPESDEAFLRAYTRIQDRFWSWIEPRGSLYVQLHKALPGELVFGDPSVMACRPLLSRGRFSWDDVRDAFLDADELLLATPVGVCCYSVHHAQGTSAYKYLYATAGTDTGVNVAMTFIDRIARGDDGALRAWNASTVFKGCRADGAWQWEVEVRSTPDLLTSHREFNGDEGRWLLDRTNEGGVRVSFSPPGAGSFSKTYNVDVRSPDLSRAILVKTGLWMPTGKDVFWVDTTLLRTKQRSGDWGFWALVIVAGILLAWLLLMRPRRPAIRYDMP